MPTVLVIGAHPDDCDIRAGGTAALWRQHDIGVVFVSMTDGSSGHHEISGKALAERRRAEAQAAGAVIGIEYRVCDHRDGHLEATLENRLSIVRLIRQAQPDLVLTHRPNDYHPDHRYTAQLVQDAAYMVTVPPVAADVPYLKRNPVFGYLADSFTRPYPFSPDVVVKTDGVLDTVIQMLHCHTSQVYEWLPFNRGVLDQVPEDDADRKAWLRDWYLSHFAGDVDRYRELLKQCYGSAATAQTVEAFEISEYGSPLTAELRQQLFPFVKPER